MNKHLSSRISPWVALGLGVGAVVVILLGTYGLTRASSRGEVMGRVEVAGTPIGGLDEEQALTALVAVEDAYVNRPALFMLDRKVITIQPPEAGFDLDTQSIVDNAMAVGRSGNPFGEFWWWLNHIFETVEVPVEGSVEDVAINEMFDDWDTEVIKNPSSPGGVVVEEGSVVPIYPRTGTGVNRAPAESIVTASLLADQAIQAEIPTTVIQAQLTDADVDAAVSDADAMVSDPIDMIYNSSAITFTPDQLIEAFRSETEVTESTTTIVNWFDPGVVHSFLDPVRAEYEDEPVNARHKISGDSISVIPGSKGTRIDEEVTAERLAVAGLTPSRRGELPIVEGSDPEITTEYLESLEINHLVSQFTTYHSCCEDRVTNIQRIAAIVDGAVVLPGKTFTVNGFVGERTEENGFVPAGTIVAGEFEDTVGGGVSQFATTFYNAVFWGGYQDVDHRPHSYYFSRYPEGIEATINWRTPDLAFRNNRGHAVLIDTIASDTSITVRFFGNNDGRTIKGEQSDGRRKVWVAAEGGPDALHVKGSVSERFALTEPRSPTYRANPELGVDSQIQIQSEAGGWSVTVTRTILRGGTDQVDYQEWVVRYAPRFAVYEVHPCKVPGTSTACPIPTTTTIPGTTTTIPGTTTTTIPGTTTTTIPPTATTTAG